MIFLLNTFIVLLLLTLLYILFKHFILPRLRLRFYEKQGLQMTFVPFSGYYVNDLANVNRKGNYYQNWIDRARQDPRPIAFGGNYGSSAHVVLLDPEIIKAHLSKTELYSKSPEFLDLWKELYRTGLIVSEGSLWQKRRRVLNTVFHYEFLKDMIGDIIKNVDRLLEIGRIDHPDGTSMIGWFQGLTGESMGRLILGEEFGKYKIEEMSITAFFSQLVEDMGMMILDPWYQTFGKNLGKFGIIKSHQKVLEEIKVFRECCYEIVENVIKDAKKKGKSDKNKGDDRKNLLELMVDQVLIDERETTDYWGYVDEIITIFSNGVDTTGHLIAMATYYLLKHPEHLPKIQNEIETHFKNSKDVNIESLNKMKYFTAFLKETLRFATPSAIPFERIALEDHTLGTINISKGTIVVIGTLANNFDTHFHDEPDKFDVNRWLDHNSLTNRSLGKFPQLWTVFYGGSKQCLGQHLAIYQAKIVLSLFLKKFDYRLLNPEYDLKMTQRMLYEPEEELIYRINRKPKNEK